MYILYRVTYHILSDQLISTSCTKHIITSTLLHNALNGGLSPWIRRWCHRWPRHVKLFTQSALYLHGGLTHLKNTHGTCDKWQKCNGEVSLLSLLWLLWLSILQAEKRPLEMDTEICPGLSWPLCCHCLCTCLSMCDLLLRLVLATPQMINTTPLRWAHDCGCPHFCCTFNCTFSWNIQSIKQSHAISIRRSSLGISIPQQRRCL